jgi:hypothetical protein
MFLIEKSANRNLVVYKGDDQVGVRIHWIMFEQPGAPTEDLNMIEVLEHADVTYLARSQCLLAANLSIRCKLDPEARRTFRGENACTGRSTKTYGSTFVTQMLHL